MLRAWFFSIVLAASCLAPVFADKPLSSWNEGPTKVEILDFVRRVTTPGDDFVEPDERIATFDNDGCLWAEQPAYFQFVFALDRVKAMAADHPEWKENAILQAAVDGDIKTILAGGKHALLEILMTSHAGMTTAEFEQAVHDWITTARHPKTGRLYSEMIYQPMLELLDYLRANKFKTFIVSGGGVEFMRVFAEEVYGVPPEQVVGSSIKTEFEYRDGNPAIVRLPEIDFIDDKEGKPVAINKFIGRRPIASFGNSDGDLQMLQWTSANEKPSFCLIVHHTDANREWAYDRDSHIGRLDKALDEAAKHNWTVVDMKNDWKTIFP